MLKLKFGLGNAKLSASIATFSIPAGHACPFAHDCLCKSDRKTGKLTDGKHAQFRCFSATGEARATSVRNARWHNFDLLRKAKTVQGMANLIHNSLPAGVAYVRLHVSGDFFNEDYFKAWLNVAIANPRITFYGYTKSLPFWVKYLKVMPSNFILTASKGGRADALISEFNLRSAEVVFSAAEAEEKGLEIDHDDSLAMHGKNSFALLLHGGQPAGSKAAAAWELIRRTVGGYVRGRQRTSTVAPVETGIELAVL